MSANVSTFQHAYTDPISVECNDIGLPIGLPLIDEEKVNHSAVKLVNKHNHETLDVQKILFAVWQMQKRVHLNYVTIYKT